MSEPTRIGDWCTLYRADSTEILDALKALGPDAVITDPPYGIGIKGAGRGRGSSGQADTASAMLRGSPPIVGDDTGVDISRWIGFAPDVLLWGADHLRAQLPSGGGFLAWDKLAGLQPWDSYCDVEFAWRSKAAAARVFSMRWKGIACDKRGELNGVRHHPMMKPTRVMQWCIEQCRLEPDSLILDPYMGSGTTAIAAFRAGMRFVGVEIERRWFDVAVERIKARCSGPLFDAPTHTE